MNVCLVSTEYPPETGWGGIGAHVYELSHGLVRHGHNVVVVARAVEGGTVYEDDGVLVYRITMPKIFQKRILWRINRIFDTYNLSVALTMRNIIRTHSIQIIEAPEARGEAFFFKLLSNLGKCRLLVKLHTGTYLTLKLNGLPLRLKDKIVIYMEKKSVQGAYQVISPSQALIELNRASDGYLFNGQTATVLRNPINLNRFQKLAKTGQEFKFKNYILYVGRIEVRKGVETIFKVIPSILEKFPGINFVFAGGDCGLKDSYLKSLSDKHRNNNIFLDHVNRDELPLFYKNALFCIFPSRWENFPFTCLEAMASGVAVIGSRSGGMAEMIEENISGLLVTPDNPEELRAKICLLLDNEELRKTLGKNAIKRVREKFDIEVVVRETIKVYQEVIDRRN
jgi:glycosyltransferase involved in cell wall biosynthesis